MLTIPDNLIPKSNYKDIQNDYDCELFEINIKDIESINKPFYYFLHQNYQKSKEIIKVGKEHRNPFNNIKSDHINIGLFGSVNVNKTDLAFRFVFNDLYEHFYDDFINNFADIDLTKVIEINSRFFELSVIDSSFNTIVDKSYYSAVQGMIFIFSIDILSKTNYIDDIRLIYKEAKNSVQDDLNCVIALKLKENQQNAIEYQEKIKSISKEFDCDTFIFSIETGENVENMFYYLAKKIVIKQKQKKKKKFSKKKKHHHKK